MKVRAGTCVDALRILPAARRGAARAGLRAALPVGLCAALCAATPARAQFAGSVSLSSNEVFRGDSTSGNDPALSLAVSLDDASGLFAGAGASVAAGGDDPRVTYASQYVGYALRRGRTSVEAGLIHRSYDRVVDPDYRRDFVEAYLGVNRGSTKLRVYLSPDYRRDGRNSYYAELNARLLAVGRWSLDGHAGLSMIPHVDAGGQRHLQNFRDWRLQVSRPAGKAFVSVGVAGTNYPVYSESGRGRVFASVSYAF